jgi:hypothetical protein
VKCSIEGTGFLIDEPAVHLVRNGGTEGLSTQPDALRTGGNSGYQAVGLAIAAGAATVVLLGYDMRAVGGRLHWHREHPASTYEGWYSDVYVKLFRKMGKLPPGVRVVNCTPGSALDCFERGALESVLPDTH